MSDPVSTFFDAWEIQAAEPRQEKIASAVTSSVRYDDPRTPETLNGVDALSEYVGNFGASAPGWTARVVASSTTAGMIRATVAFGGPGPDGKEMVQHGQYFVETEGDLISRMVGFAGLGSPE